MEKRRSPSVSESANRTNCLCLKGQAQPGGKTGGQAVGSAYPNLSPPLSALRHDCQGVSSDRLHKVVGAFWRLRSAQQGRSGGQLTEPGVSDNVGGVKLFLDVLLPALRGVVRFALVEALCSNLRLAHNQLRVRTRSDPCISSVPRSIMIASSDSPSKGGSRLPNRFLGVLPHTNAWFGPARVRTKLLPLLVIPSFAPHPVQTDR